MKKYLLNIIKWSLIGLVLRVIIMPFTMHTQDSVFINYFPMLFVNKGIWDPYGYISTYMPHFPYTYYGPVLFIIMSGINFIFIKIFKIASLVKMLELSGPMLYKDFTTVDYLSAFSGLSNYDLFKNLFLTKSIYLVFDFLIAALLLKMATSKEFGVKSYILWMLNVVVLHSVYAIGTFDLIPAFLITLALFAAAKKRPYLCVICLSLGGATKLFPYLLILPTSLLLGENWKKRLGLLCTAAITTIAIFLPFCLSSGCSVFGFFFLSSAKQYPGILKWIFMGIFISLYVKIALEAIKESKDSNQRMRKLLFYFLIIGFLSYAVTPISFRYFIFITPLLALIIPYHRKYGIFILVIIFMLAFLRLHQRELQLGLFSPLNPSYFMNFPTIQELVGRFIDIQLIYSILARFLMLALVIAAWWTWRIKLVSEKSQA